MGVLTLLCNGNKSIPTFEFKLEYIYITRIEPANTRISIQKRRPPCTLPSELEAEFQPSVHQASRKYR